MGQIQTVAGPLSAETGGIFLPHEHLFLDFAGAAEVDPAQWDEAEAFDVILPQLLAAKERGVGLLAECTPMGIGRNPALLRQLSEASGVGVLTNTGVYTAAGGRFIPPGAEQKSPDELAEEWHAEWRDGIADTGIRPGFIKIGVDGGALIPVGERVVRAAARLQQRTGLVIGSHTADAEAFWAQLAVLEEEGVDPARFIWIHAQLCSDTDQHIAAARKGAWVEFDGLSPDSIEQHLQFAGALRDEGLLDRCLLSHDAGWYDANEDGGGTFRSFADLMDAWIPAARRAGWTAEEIDRVTITNPRRAFRIADKTG